MPASEPRGLNRTGENPGNYRTMPENEIGKGKRQNYSKLTYVKLRDQDEESDYSDQLLLETLRKHNAKAQLKK
mgnify:CR=1 FL=1